MLFNFEGTVKAALSATCGDNSEEVPPVPIPNTVVKLLSADDTWGVTLWEIRTSPLFSFFDNFIEKIRNAVVTAVLFVLKLVHSKLVNLANCLVFWTLKMIK